MRRVFGFLVLCFAVAFLGAFWIQWDRPPRVDPGGVPAVAGGSTSLRLNVESPGPGLARVRLLARREAQTWTLYEQSFPRSSWRGSAMQSALVETVPNWGALGISDGELHLELWASTYGWHWRGHDRAPLWEGRIVLDTTPPRIELLTTQHNVRLGGVELAIWRQSPDAVQTGVEVGSYFFPAALGYFADPQLALGLFAVPQDLDGSVQPRAVAVDAAGNRSQVNIPVRIQVRRFAERTLAIDDDFLSRKVPEIEAANQLPATGTLLERYLRINRDLRRRNEETLREMTRQTGSMVHWLSAFHRQSNSAPLSSFADRRTYVYRGEEVDRQVHLGFDLASLKASPVEAAQSGTVVFAGNLGIYGNTVVVDHGLGIFTLYGHLRSIEVQVGEPVTRGQRLGLTGETGLAAGDHLHFSVMLRGIHVDPVEWWDGDWIRKHLSAKIALFPVALAEKTSTP
ncbi:MAG: peptidase M24 [Candidatus Binatia bacterium]|nr:MAG: peptidase M24 [Candidatus Binatia bacterium]